jgi:hypothetical protein
MSQSPAVSPPRRIDPGAIVGAVLVVALILAGVWYVFVRKPAFTEDQLRPDPQFTGVRDPNSFQARQARRQQMIQQMTARMNDDGVMLIGRSIRIKSGDLVVQLISARTGYRLDFEPGAGVSPQDMRWLQARRLMMSVGNSPVELTEEQRTALRALAPSLQIEPLLQKLTPLANQWRDMGYNPTQQSDAVRQQMQQAVSEVDAATRAQIVADYAKRAAAVRDLLTAEQRAAVEQTFNQ